MKFNIVDLFVIAIIVVCFVVSLIIINRNKGKCAYCSHNESCPFKKANKDAK